MPCHVSIEYLSRVSGGVGSSRPETVSRRHVASRVTQITRAVTGMRPVLSEVGRGEIDKKAQLNKCMSVLVMLILGDDSVQGGFNTIHITMVSWEGI